MEQSIYTAFQIIGFIVFTIVLAGAYSIITNTRKK